MALRGGHVFESWKMARGIILALLTLLSALAVSHGLKCQHSCTGSADACGGSDVSAGSRTCDASYEHGISGNKVDAACVKMTVYDASKKAEYTTASCYGKGTCETMDAMVDLLKLLDDADSKAMVAAYKCDECTTDNCNGATELRAGGVMTAILVSAVTLLSVRN